MRTDILGLHTYRHPRPRSQAFNKECLKLAARISI